MTEPNKNPRRTWLMLGLALAAAWCLCLWLVVPKLPRGGAFDAPRLEPPNAAGRANYDWTLRDLNDAPVPFSRFKDRTVFLNIWATWCPPCRAELPSIVNLAENRKLKDVVFLCVSTDQSAEDVRSFVRDQHWPMTVLRAVEVPEVFATEGIPATFLIARDGSVAAAHVGAAQWDDPSVVAFLEKLDRSVKP